MNDYDDSETNLARTLRAMRQEYQRAVLDDIRRLLSRGHVPDDVWSAFEEIERKYLA